MKEEELKIKLIHNILGSYTAEEPEKKKYQKGQQQDSMLKETGHQ